MPTVAEPKKHALDAIRKLTAIATLPEITAKIIATVEDPKSTAATLHKLISHDPALVTRILKLVNSSFYGLPGQISSIERAIVLLGLTAVKNVAVAASIGQMFRGVKLCEGFTAKDLWTHCIAVAVGARELARHLKIPICDEAFLGGMIHDIGILVSLQMWPERFSEVCDRVQISGQEFIMAEREIIGIDHAEIGATLAEQWKFPRSCQQVAGHHHRPVSHGGQARSLLAIVHIADTMACHAGLGFHFTGKKQSLDANYLNQFGVPLSTVTSVMQTLPQMVESARALLA